MRWVSKKCIAVFHAASFAQAKMEELVERKIFMPVRQRRYSKEELARRGQELYKSGIRQQVEAGNDGKIVAIDSNCGERK